MTDRWVADSGLAIGAITAEFDRVVRSTCPEQLPLATRLLDRIRPERWTLEWFLPLWLGEALGVRPEITKQIVVSNVLGLGSIRLEDDLVDGDVPPDEVAGARLLSSVLLDAALQPYRAAFGGDSPFWLELDRRMAEWRAATRPERPMNNRPGGRAAEPGRLSAKGAPLHISAHAVCLAANRPDCFRLLRGCLDHALEALVLYDHAVDWEADLEAGRWNAFVAAMAKSPATPAQPERLRTAVHVGLMTSDDAGAYFARIGDQLSSAIAAAERLPVPVPRLVEYLRSLDAEIKAHGASYRDRYRELGDRAARSMFQGITDGR